MQPGMDSGMEAKSIFRGMERKREERREEEEEREAAETTDQVKRRGFEH